MGVEKEPLKDQKQFDKILEVATRESDDVRKIILLLRYTGMHISVVCDKQYNLREELYVGEPYIIWKRTKKEGKEAYCSVLKSQYIDFDVHKFAKEIWKRKRRKTRQYFYELVKKVGLRAGIPGLSPMTFRHTLGVDMAERGVPRDVIQETLNCSDKVLRTYLKYSKSRKRDILKGIGR